MTPDPQKQTQLYEAIQKIIDNNRKRASLTAYGETKLYSGTDSDAEDLAATPKAVKGLKTLIDADALTRNLTNYIPNSKKSNAVNSTSSDTVATSSAVKTAYDKGVEAKSAADKAQQSANTAQQSANNAKATADKAQQSANKAQTAADKAQTAADKAQQTAEVKAPVANPIFTINKTYADMDTIPSGTLFCRINERTANQPQPNGNPLNFDAQAWQFDSGDQNTQFIIYSDNDIRVRYNDDGQRWTSWNTMLTSKNLSDAVTNPARDIPASVGGVKIAYDHGTTALNAANAAKKAADNANHELNNTYRKNRFKDRRCPSHYNGAQVFDISTQDDGGIRIIIMSALWGGGETVLNLPEAFSGFAIPTAVDLGGGRKKLGIAMEGNNKIRVFAPSGIIGIHVHVIGFTHF